MLRPEQVLELDTRRRVFDYVHLYPGFHLREISRAVGLNPNHVKYHLRFLERHGLVSSRREDGYWRFYPREEGTLGLREAMSPADKLTLSFLRRPVPLHVTLVLLDRGPTTHSGLLEFVHISHATLHYHLKRMEAALLLKSVKVGRERFYEVAEPQRTQGLLLKYKPPDQLVKGFLQAWEQLEL